MYLNKTPSTVRIRSADEMVKPVQITDARLFCTVQINRFWPKPTSPLNRQSVFPIWPKDFFLASPPLLGGPKKFFSRGPKPWTGVFLIHFLFKWVWKNATRWLFFSVVFKYALENRITEIYKKAEKNGLKRETEEIKIEGETSASGVRWWQSFTGRNKFFPLFTSWRHTGRVEADGHTEFFIWGGGLTLRLYIVYVIV